MRQSGFSLLELMITVSIVGILSSIAVPLYQHQVNRAHQAEAKANLSTLDSSEKSFWSEYAAPTARFDVLGYKPSGTLFYGVGFSNDFQGPPGVLNNAAATGGSNCITTNPIPNNCNATFTAGGIWQNGAASVPNSQFGTGSNGVNDTVPGPSFVGNAWHGYARAQLSTNGTADEWTIDSRDNLVNSLNGL